MRVSALNIFRACLSLRKRVQPLGRAITFEQRCDRRGVVKSPAAGWHPTRTKYLESYDDNEYKS